VLTTPVGGLVDTVKYNRGAKQSVVGATTQRVQLRMSSYLIIRSKQYERLVVNKQVTTGEVGIAEQGETQTADNLVPVDKEPVVEPTTLVDAVTPVIPSETDLHVND